MLKQYNLKLPHAVYGNDDVMEQVVDTLKTSGTRKVAVFTDKGTEKAGLFALPGAAIETFGVGYYMLGGPPAEPNYEAVQKLIDESKRSGTDLIVVYGGGSVMDAAKLTSVLATDDYDVKELLDTPDMAKKCVPIILIPTTARTDAEVMSNAIVAVPERELKVGIVNENVIVDYVILDTEIIENLPRPIAAATGADALAHCIKRFTGNKANPFSDIHALEGLDLILNSIEKTCDDPEVMGEENRMQIAAYYDDLAVTTSGTTTVYALNHPFGGKYHIARDVSNVILLAPVMCFNSEDSEVKERFALAYDCRCHEEEDCEIVEKECEWTMYRVGEVVEHFDIPKSLKSFGVPEEDLEGLMQAGVWVRRLFTNSRRLVTKADTKTLYLEVM